MITIPRDKWIRGEIYTASTLGTSMARPDGSECFMGHLLSSMGASHEELENYFEEERLLMGIIDRDGRLASHLIRSRMVAINDDPTSSDEEKEKLLSELAAKNGFEVEFV
jgi:hypothetical protein